MLRRAWEIQMLGKLALTSGESVISRFKTQKVARLLSLLAFHSPRRFPRDELVEFFWSDCSQESGQNALRVALSAVRQSFEGQGTEVVLSHSGSIGLNADVLTSDVSAFEKWLKKAEEQLNGPDERYSLSRAIEIYRGELLPGFFDDWIHPERHRLGELYRRSLRRLSRRFEEDDRPEAALELALRAVAADPLGEKSAERAMRVLLRLGRAREAERLYEQLREMLAKELSQTPSHEIERLHREVRRALRRGIVAVERNEKIAPANGPEKGGARGNRVQGGRSSDGPALWSQAPSPVPPPAPRPTSSGSFSESTCSVPGAPSSLPFALGSFFGREQELAELFGLLGDIDTRLITLVGPGGIGKTRTGLELVRRAAEAGDVEAWHVSLPDLAIPQVLPTLIAQAMGLPAAQSSNGLEEIVSALGTRRALVVLDNIDGLVDGGAEEVTTLLKRLPELRILATSRRALGVEGEQEYLIGPLETPLPEWDPVAGLETASVRLLIDLIRRRKWNFLVTPSNTAAILALSRQLEGIPLAIELAAGWMKSLSPEEMMQRMERRLDLLVSPHKNAPERHRSLRAALDGSYHGLPEPTRASFSRLSVFRDGWTLHAAEAVLRLPDTMQQIHQLVDSSLVCASSGDSLTRFKMLDLVREYASEQLVADEQVSLADRHAMYYKELAAATARALDGPEAGEWLRRIGSEAGNLAAALDWLIQRDPPSGLSMATSLWRPWYLQGRLREGQSWLQHALERGGEATPLNRACALNALGNLEAALGELRTSHERHQESMALARMVPDERLAAANLCNLASLALADNRLTDASALYEEALCGYRRTQHTTGIVIALGNIGATALLRESVDDARAAFEECLSLSRAAGNVSAEANALHNLGETELLAKSPGSARIYFEKSLGIRLETGEQIHLWQTLQCMACVLLHLGNPTTGVKFFAAASAAQNAHAATALPGARQRFETALNSARRTLGEQHFQEVWEAGETEGATVVAREYLEQFRALRTPNYDGPQELTAEAGPSNERGAMNKQEVSKKSGTE